MGQGWCTPSNNNNTIQNETTELVVIPPPTTLSTLIKVFRDRQLSSLFPFPLLQLINEYAQPRPTGFVPWIEPSAVEKRWWDQYARAYKRYKRPCDFINYKRSVTSRAHRITPPNFIWNNAIEDRSEDDFYECGIHSIFDVTPMWDPLIYFYDRLYFGQCYYSGKFWMTLKGAKQRFSIPLHGTAAEERCVRLFLLYMQDHILCRLPGAYWKKIEL